MARAATLEKEYNSGDLAARQLRRYWVYPPRKHFRGTERPTRGTVAASGTAEAGLEERLVLYTILLTSDWRLALTGDSAHHLEWLSSDSGWLTATRKL